MSPKREPEPIMEAQELIGSVPAPKKHKRRKKDPSAPKKPLTAFVYFGQTMRPKLLVKSPDMKFTEVGAELGKLWAKLSEAGKKPYDKKAQEDKARYTKEMEGYVPDAAYLQAVAKKGTQRLKKDPAKPKRSRSAYLVFCDVHRPALQQKHSECSMTEVAVKLAALWGAVSPEEKAECEAVAATEKVVYDEKLASYTPSEEYVKAKEGLEQARRDEKKKETEAKTKAKEKLNKCKGKVKELQGEIVKIEKAVALAAKAKLKLPLMHEELSKTESKLAEMIDAP